MRKGRLTTDNHDRDAAGLTYIYPVISRRAGGLSVGINLNPNQACNWRCIYCQVPDLVRGAAPEIDQDQLARELRGFLAEVLDGSFLEERLPEGSRRLVDVAFSGNGEPTTATDFAGIVNLVGQILEERGLAGTLPLRLITNGSQMLREDVQAGVAELGRLSGEVWFKLDRATEAGRREVNDVAGSMDRVLEQLAASCRLASTWLQTCLFTLDGQPPAEEELEAWLAFVAHARSRGIELAGVLLYGLARPSLQPEAPRLGPLPAEWMTRFADRIETLGLTARISD